MGNDLQVLADGVDVETSSRSSGSPMLMGVLAVVLVVGFVIVSVTVPAQQAAEDAPLQDDLGGPQTGSLTAEMGIAEVIAGFEGALVGVVAGSDGGFNHLLWPRDQGVLNREMPSGEQVAFDAAGQHLAMITGQSETGDILHAGRFNQMEQVSVGVTSFSWHDSEPGDLGFTTVGEAGWTLWRVKPIFTPRAVATGLDGGRLAAWGDWGFAVETPDATVTLLTPDGEFKARHPGRVLTSTGDGWIVVVNDAVEMVSAGGGVVRMGIDADRVGEFRVAAFSPDGEALAMTGSKGVLVVPTRGEGEIFELGVRDAGTLTWSTNSRFLAVPGPDGVSVLDMETVNRYTILEDYEFRALSVVPLAGS